MAEKAARPYTIGDLLRVMARLRDPDTGCPWDREQSFATIAPYTIEEAYEVADAIARNDLDGLKDELGDLLLQNLGCGIEPGPFGYHLAAVKEIAHAPGVHAGVSSAQFHG